LWLYNLCTDSARVLLPKIRIRAVSCGQQHGISLDDKGGAWAWGSSAKGQCGLGSKDNIIVPRRITSIAGGVNIDHLQVCI